MASWPSSAGGTGTSGPYSATRASVSTANSSTARAAICSSCMRRVACAICTPWALLTTLSSSVGGPGSGSWPPSARRPVSLLACSACWRSASAAALEAWILASGEPGPLGDRPGHRGRRGAHLQPGLRRGRGLALGHRGRGQRVGPPGDGPQPLLDGADLEPGLHLGGTGRGRGLAQLLLAGRRLLARVDAAGVLVGERGLRVQLGQPGLQLGLGGQVSAPEPAGACAIAWARRLASSLAARAAPARAPSRPDVCAAAASTSWSARLRLGLSSWRACSSSSTAAASSRSAIWRTLVGRRELGAGLPGRRPRGEQALPARRPAAGPVPRRSGHRPASPRAARAQSRSSCSPAARSSVTTTPASSSSTAAASSGGAWTRSRASVGPHQAPAAGAWPGFRMRDNQVGLARALGPQRGQDHRRPSPGRRRLRRRRPRPGPP